jgi:proline iminopeptidase
MEKLLYKQTPKLKEYYLQVDPIHFLFISHYGNVKKPVVLFIHGGPGAGTEDFCSRFFNPKNFHIVLFDQRGCGKSKPQCELKRNQTKYLIQDIETIRKHIGVKKIILFGGSWGATLSILYAIQYPQNVSFYIIRGICLCDNKSGEVFSKSLSLMYPELWEKYIELSKQKNPLLRSKEYYNKIKQKNQEYIDNWYNLEFKTLTPDPKDIYNKIDENEKFVVSLLESHYYSNKFFLPSNYIINNIHRIKSIPGIFIHGRLDVICSLEDSYKLSKKLPNAKLRIVEKGGHSYYDPLITKALINATKEIINKKFDS